MSLEQPALAPTQTLVRAPYLKHLLALSATWLHLSKGKHMLTWPRTWHLSSWASLIRQNCRSVCRPLEP